MKIKKLVSAVLAVGAVMMGGVAFASMDATIACGETQSVLGLWSFTEQTDGWVVEGADYGYLFDLRESGLTGLVSRIRVQADKEAAVMYDEIEFVASAPEGFDGVATEKTLPRREWDFSESTYNAWVVAGDGSGAYVDNSIGGIRIGFTGEKSASFVLTLMNGPDIDVYKYLVVKIRNDTGAQTLNVYYGTDSEKENSEDKKKSVSIYNLEGWQYYLFDFSTAEKWKGSLEGNLFFQVFAPNGTGTFDFGSIKLYSDMAEIAADGVKFAKDPNAGEKTELPEYELDRKEQPSTEFETRLNVLPMILLSIGGIGIVGFGIWAAVVFKKARRRK